MKKDENKLNKEKCKGCTTCCEYISVPLKTPKTEEDFDMILWYILHKKVYVWIKEPNNWHVRFETNCKPLKKNICREYLKRPMLCREYKQETCEKEDKTKDEKYAFHTKKQLIDYLKKHKKQFYGFY